MTARALRLSSGLATALITSGCASGIATPPLSSHRLDTGSIALRFSGFEHAHMGFARLELATVVVERVRDGSWLEQAFLTRVRGRACGSGIAASLIDTSAGRTGEGDIVIESPGHIKAGFDEDAAEDVCEESCRLDLQIAEVEAEPRCITLQLTR